MEITQKALALIAGSERNFVGDVVAQGALPVEGTQSYVTPLPVQRVLRPGPSMISLNRCLAVAAKSE